MTLHIMQGVPGSGKSTLAKELGFARLNRDSIREMMHAGGWSKDNEKITVSAEVALAKMLLGKGLDVIIDDTNLRHETCLMWEGVADEFPFANVEYHVLDTPVEECIRRDAARDRSVGEEVIRKFQLSKDSNGKR